MLSAAARTMIADPSNTLLLSAASLWEMAIKHAQGRKDFPQDPTAFHRTMLDFGCHELPVTGAHALATGTLPPIHKDPFDRILVAQAIVENALLLTADPLLARYPAPVRLV